MNKKPALNSWTPFGFQGILKWLEKNEGVYLFWTTWPLKPEQTWHPLNRCWFERAARAPDPGNDAVSMNDNWDRAAFQYGPLSSPMRVFVNLILEATNRWRRLRAE
jgi:hypothetical protein